MKMNQFPLLALIFVSGIIISIAALGLLSFTNTNKVPVSNPSFSKISLQEANSLFKGYYNSAHPTDAIVKGYSINRDQLTVLNALPAEIPGFQDSEYMGYDRNSGSVAIVVGVNSAGQDVTDSIYWSAAIGSGPCPTICDIDSVITTK